MRIVCARETGHNKTLAKSSARRVKSGRTLMQRFGLAYAAFLVVLPWPSCSLNTGECEINRLLQPLRRRRFSYGPTLTGNERANGRTRNLESSLRLPAKHGRLWIWL